MTNAGRTAQADFVETELEGTALLTNPMLNKGTAFTNEERTAFALHGLLPPHVGTLEVQSARRLQAMLIAGPALAGVITGGLPVFS